MSRHSNHLLRLPSSRSGVALIIVLAFVVLLTAVIVAFFSRAMNDRGISNNSANQTKADLFAQGAANTIIGTLKQEILMSSSATPLATTTIYTPLTPASMLPQISGTTSSLTGNPANLLKRSAYNYSSGGPVPMYVGPNGSAGTTGTIAGSAINVSSTTPSLNGRSVSLARWNSVYLLPLLPNPTDSTPVTTGTSAFTAPDWVLVARNGSQPTTWNSNMVTSAANGTTVIGRYAYAIYHEGGLLDVNAAGYPMTGGSGAAANSSAVLTGSQTGYKNNLAFADLTQLPGINTLSASQQQALTYNLVGWRNYASAQSSGTFGNYSFGSGLNYYNFAVSNPAGFLMASGTALYNGQTDHMFESRQELINFLQNGLSLPLANLGCLNYLATFTRDLNQPSFTPNPGRPTVLLWNATTSGSGGNNAYGLDNQINPSFLTTRVTGTFARDDGSSAVIGEPLVKKRFALSRLAWLTYQGPSALRTQFAVGAASPGTTSPDYDMWALVNLYGVSPALLAQGTAANIKKYFGLTYTPNDKDPAGPIISSAWVYNVHNGSSGVGPTGSIMQLGKIAALGSSAHEPDFFELLKAAINVGSLGKATTQSNSVATLNNGSCFGSQTIPGSAALPANYRYTQDTDVDAQIIQIGANIISQAKVDGYPAHIFFDNGSGSPIRVFAGVKSFPYLDYVFQGALIASLPKTDASRSGGNPDPVPVPNTDPTNGMLTNPGLGVLLQIPALWNPHDPNGSVPSIRPTKFRLVADSTDPLHIDSTGAGNSNYTRYYSMAACTVGGTNFTDFTGTVYSSNSTGSPAYPGITNIYQTPPTYNSEYLTSANTNLQFTDVGGALFHEPTILFRAGSAAAGNPMSLIDGETAGSKSSWSLLHDVGANTITCPDVNPTGLPATEGNTTIDPTNSQYLGIYMGAFPLRFYALGKSGTTWTVTTNQVNYWIDGGSSATVIGGLYLTSLLSKTGI